MDYKELSLNSVSPLSSELFFIVVLPPDRFTLLAHSLLSHWLCFQATVFHKK